MGKKCKVLFFSDWYPPAFKAGGPINSVYNLANLIKDSFEVSVLTSAYDHGDEDVLENIECDKWIVREGVRVFYSTKGLNISREAQRIVQLEGISLVYFNSMFSIPFALKPFFYLRKNNSLKFIWSPRGMLKASAVANKSFKKKSLLALLKAFRLTKNIHFIASDSQEKKDLKYWFGANTSVNVISNVPKNNSNFKGIYKEKGSKTKICFIGRVHPIKNLDLALKCLNKLPESSYEFKIIGPIEDKSYFKTCMNILGNRSNTVFLGPIPPKKIENELSEAHILFLPTKGENFGHAIFESFTMGRPVIISDQTPWRELSDKEIGFDINLNSVYSFVKALQFFFDLDQDKYDEYCKNAFTFAKHFIEQQNLKNKYLEAFNYNSL